MQKGNLVALRAEMREEVADVLAALTVLLELPFRAHHAAAVFLAAAAKGFHLNRLAVERIHLGLVIKRIHLARAAVHEEKNHVLRLGRQRRVLRLERVFPRRLAVGGHRLVGEKAILRHHARQRQRREAAAHLVHKLTPRGAPAKRVHRFLNIRHKLVQYS